MVKRIRVAVVLTAALCLLVVGVLVALHLAVRGEYPGEYVLETINGDGGEAWFLARFGPPRRQLRLTLSDPAIREYSSPWRRAALEKAWGTTRVVDVEEWWRTVLGRRADFVGIVVDSESRLVLAISGWSVGSALGASVIGEPPSPPRKTERR